MIQSDSASRFVFLKRKKKKKFLTKKQTNEKHPQKNKQQQNLKPQDLEMIFFAHHQIWKLSGSIRLGHEKNK